MQLVNSTNIDEMMNGRNINCDIGSEKFIISTAIDKCSQVDEYDNLYPVKHHCSNLNTPNRWMLSEEASIF